MKQNFEECQEKTRKQSKLDQEQKDLLKKEKLLQKHTLKTKFIQYMCMQKRFCHMGKKE